MQEEALVTEVAGTWRLVVLGAVTKPERDLFSHKEGQNRQHSPDSGYEGCRAPSPGKGVAARERAVDDVAVRSGALRCRTT